MINYRLIPQAVLEEVFGCVESEFSHRVPCEHSPIGDVEHYECWKDLTNRNYALIAFTSSGMYRPMAVTEEEPDGWWDKDNFLEDSDE